MGIWVLALASMTCWYFTLSFKSFCLFSLVFLTLLSLPAILTVVHLRYRVSKNWGKRFVIDRNLGGVNYFYPCLQEGADWLAERNFQYSPILGGYKVPRSRWIEAHKGLRDGVGCMMESLIRF